MKTHRLQDLRFSTVAHVIGWACASLGCTAQSQVASAPTSAAGAPAAAETAANGGAATAHLASRFEGIMPQGLTTMGATALGNSLYLVGGYFGSPHDYSKEFQSGSVQRLNLETGSWESLPEVKPIQSPALTSDGRYVYKIGGLHALNAADAPTRLLSIADVERFDPAQGTWQKLPNLPEPRSSHQAVVVGQTLYVVGGWAMDGGMYDATWSKTMLSADLSQPEIVWKEHPMPFQIRAQGLAAHRGKLYVLGGLDTDGGTDRVHRYDIATQTWSEGPSMPAENLTTRAAVWQGELYANGADGNVYRLSQDESQWEPAGSVRFPRLFHELVETESGPLVVGGIPQNGRGARVRLIERLSTDPTPAGVVWNLPAKGSAKNRQGAFVWSQQLFLFGGNTSLGQHDFAPENFVNETVRLDLGALEWRTVADFPVSRQSMQALVVGEDDSRALVLGGFGFEGDHLATHADVFAHDIMKKQWSTLDAQKLPEGLSQFGLAEWQNAVWVFGGMNYDASREKADQMRHSTKVLRLDMSRPDAQFETASVQLREPRRAFAGALLGDKYYLTGGMKENFASVTSCEVIDLAQQKSEAFACPSQHRIGADLVAVGQKLYLVGGSVAGAKEGREASTRVEVFDPASGSWSALPNPVPVDTAEQLRAFNFQDQLLLFSAQRTDGQVQVALLDPEALAASKQDYVRMNVPEPPTASASALAHGPAHGKAKAE